jgi:hypothetical protein
VLGMVALQPKVPADGPVQIMLRPEQIALVAPGAGVSARTLSSVFHGDYALVTVAVGDTTLELRLSAFGDYSGPLHLGVSGPGMAFARVTSPG